MKKIIAFALILAAVLSLVACGGGGGGGKGPKASDYPLTYAPIYDSRDVVSEDNADGKYTAGFGGAVYDASTTTVVEYLKATDELYTLLNGKSEWPAELNDEWKGYGYVGIENTAELSRRTLDIGQYGTKHANILRLHEGYLYDYGFKVSAAALTWPEDESLRTVPYCMIEATKENVTIAEIASAAYEALYLQAWMLVPAANQGVLVNVDGEIYLVADIIDELGK